jgi:hypothetical protein
MRRCVWLFLVSSAFGQLYPYAPPAPTTAGGPSEVQVSPNVTSGGASTTCQVFATNPSTTCTFGASLGASHHLTASILASAAVTSFTTPTGSGAGCPSTWTVVGTSGTKGAIYISSATSAGACTVTIAAASSGGLSLQGTIRELAGVIATADVSSISQSVGFCTSCTGPSMTTSVSGDFVTCDALATGSAGTMAVTSPFTADVNTTGGVDQISGYRVQASAGAISMAYTSSGGSGWIVNCVAVEP